MANPIAKLFVSLGLDTNPFAKDAKGAETAASGIGTKVKAAAGLLAGAASVGFGFMVKGAMESERAMGEFQAATGKTADEAKAFVKDMNSLVGTNATVGQSFEQIAATGTKVVQQFELSGQAAEDMTARFSAFAKVTRQDAAAAVDDFDATLDAFGEPAERATSLMDQLIASSQKFGTDAGPAALSALAQMAPALEAMGMGLDDGVALLNLFEAAGIDASKAPALLNKAIKQLKPGQDLDDLIAQLAAIEDPLLRGQKAAELFGIRGGSAMANAIKPGMRSLDEFGISAEEAAGKTEKASDAMVTTSDRIRMFFDRLGAGLRDVGTEFGPVLSGLGGLVTALAPLSGKLSGVLTGVWKKLGGDIAVKAAIAAAGTAAGFIYQGAAFVGSKLLAVAVAAWAFITAPMASAAGAAGAASGVAYAAGFAGALTATTGLAAVLAGPAVLAIAATAGGAAGTAFLGSATGGGFLAVIRNLLPGGLQLALAPLALATTWDTQAQPFQMQQHSDGSFWLGDSKVFDAPGPKVVRAMSEMYGGAIAEGVGGATDVAAKALSGQARFDQLFSKSSGAVNQIGSAMASLAGKVIDGGKPVSDAFHDVFDDAVFEITKGFGNVKSALQGGDGIVSPEKRLANMRNRLAQASANLRKAIAVGDPIGISKWTAGVARASSVLTRFEGKTGQTRQAVAGKLKALGVDVSRVFGGIAQDTKRKSKDGADAAIAQAERMRRRFVRISLRSAGREIIASWVQGILSAQTMVTKAGQAVAGWLGQFFHGSAVPKVGPLKGFDRMGRDMLRAYGREFEGEKKRLGLFEAQAPRPTMALAGGLAGGIRAGRGDTHIHIHGDYFATDANYRKLQGRIDKATRPTTRNRRRNRLPEG